VDSSFFILTESITKVTYCKKANSCEDSVARRFNPCEDSVFVGGRQPSFINEL